MIFIAPGSDKRTTVGPMQRFIHHSFPFGIASLASKLEQDGLPVRIVNDAITPLTKEKIAGLAFGGTGRPIFGISILTIQVKRAIELNAMIKTVVPEARTIAGGIHPTAMPEEMLSAGFDYVFAGEADTVISELVAKLSADQDIGTVPGLIGLDAKGDLIKNQPIDNFIDLATLPCFPFHLFKEDIEHYDLGVVMTSRGCPYSCIFCSQRAMTGNSYRTRPIPHVMEEISLLVELYAVRHICFFDDNLVVNKKRIIDLCDNLIERGFSHKVTFFAQLRGDAAKPEILDKMVAAGFEGVSFGFETGSEKIAKSIKKAETVKTNRDAVNRAKQKGLRVAATFIIGFPGETNDDRRQTVTTALQLPLDSMRVNVAIPYPGTPLYDMTVKDLVIAPYWSNFNVVTPLVTGPFHPQPLPYVPTGTTQNELRYLMLATNLKFWLRPSGIIKFFTAPTTGVSTIPKRWYLKPAIIIAVIKLGWSMVLLFAWLLYLGLQRWLKNRSANNSE